MLSTVKAVFKRSADAYELKSMGLLDASAPASYPALGRLMLSGSGWRQAGGLIRASREVHRRKLRSAAFNRAYPIGPEDWGISCPLQLGDVYLFASLANALLTRLGGERVIFCTKPQHAFIPRLFPSVSESIAVEPPFSPNEIGRLDRTLYQIDGHKGHYLRVGLGVAHMMGYGTTTLLDCWRADLRLPADAALEKPRAPHPHEVARATELLARNDLTPGRVAILCPDATTTVGMRPIPEEFWEKLVLNLKQLGIQCVTNVGGPAHRLLKGAPGLSIPLEEFRAIAQVAGHVVSNRSGISDLVSDLPLNLVVLYPAGDFLCSTLLRAAGLRAMGLREDAIEVELDVDHWGAALSSLMNALESVIPSAPPI